MLGATVGWDQQSSTATATKSDIVVTIKIGDSYAHKNGVRFDLPQAAVTVEGTTMVPLRFVSEALGAEVRWDEETQTIYITVSPS